MITLLHKVMVVKNKICSEPPLLFGDGKMALEFLLSEYSSNESYLILLDINMPVLNGWEFLDSVQSKQFANNLFVVIVTSSVDSSDKQKAKTYPQVIGFLEKPLRAESCDFIKNIPSISSFFA
jgi:CheY-like chemotaxis protein